MQEKIVLVDGYSLMYRAFHALPILDNGAGVYTNAIYGFMTMLFRVLEEEKPAYCAVAFDEHGKTFRHERYEAYKAGRAPTPEEFKPQIPLIREMLEKMGICRLALAGYEADDILGTVSRMCEEKHIEAILVTGDRDSYQLAGEYTTILYTKRGITDTERVTSEWIFEKYGVTPGKLIDIKGLMGDASDNIPGVPGVGEKTAIKLIHEFGTLENALEKADTCLKGAVRTRLMENAAVARESKFLATIVRDAPLDFDFENARVGDFSGAIPMMRNLRLKSLIENIPASGVRPQERKPAKGKKPMQVQGADEIFSAVSRWLSDGVCAIGIYLGQRLSLSTDRGECLVCELGGDLLSPGLTAAEISGALRPVCENERVRAVFHNIKAFEGDISAFAGRADDTMLASYVINPQRSADTLEEACAQEEIDFDADCPAASLIPLMERQRAVMERDGLADLYCRVEMPLAFVLRDMENAGFQVDTAYLRSLGEIYRTRISVITQEIASMAGAAGEGVNLNSPKQLAKLLYEDLGIKPLKGGKSGQSTAAEVLEELSESYPICAKILEYRKYQKLNSTYVEGLVDKCGADGRIHTSFEQAVTGTGRISSREPNLQNIPVRTELGREIRRAFTAAEGCVLLDADYSQIELRVLAHMADDEGMKGAFIRGEDVHLRTAAEVYGVPLGEVTREMRSNAKAVNFGIVYGISDFGLAKNIGVSRREAAEFIETYLSRYPNVKRYMDRQIAEGKAQGYVSTMLGRRRYLPELASSAYTMRSFGERAAMNSPVQGTAADIIKLAMVKVHAEIKKRGLRAKLILQVHDELIVEAPFEEAEAVKALLIEGMESVMHLSVPLKAELSTGGNWNECKS